MNTGESCWGAAVQPVGAETEGGAEGNPPVCTRMRSCPEPYMPPVMMKLPAGRPEEAAASIGLAIRFSCAGGEAPWA